MSLQKKEYTGKTGTAQTPSAMRDAVLHPVGTGTRGIRVFSVGCLFLFISCFLLVSAVYAISNTMEIPASQDPLERDSPENLAALKSHIAYTSESQEARMSGVISYIERISDRQGIEKLHQIRNDYLAAAATIPVLPTADGINDIQGDMCKLSQQFAAETKSQIQFFNGTTDAMQESINVSEQAFDESMNNAPDPLWLSHDNARLKVFLRESRERTEILESLNKSSVDITEARAVSDRIDAKRPELETALHKRDGSIGAVNTEIKSLNQQFRNTIAKYHRDLKTRQSIAASTAMRD